MHIVIEPNKKVSFGFYGFDNRDGFTLRIPFLACSVFYTSADKLLADTFRQVKMRRSFIAVGSKDWCDEIDRQTEELRKRNSIDEKRLREEIMELRKKLGDTQVENRTLRNAIKIVSDFFGGGGREAMIRVGYTYTTVSGRKVKIVTRRGNSFIRDNGVCYDCVGYTDKEYRLCLVLANAEPARPVKLEPVAIVKVVPKQIWAEKDIIGTVHVYMQNGDDEPFEFITMNYDHHHTCNSHQAHMTKQILKLLGVEVGNEHPYSRGNRNDRQN